MNYPLLLGGALIGVILSRWINRKKQIKIHADSLVIHLRHWFTSTIVLAILIAVGIYDPFLYGVLLGLVIHGLTIQDFYHIIYRKKD